MAPPPSPPAVLILVKRDDNELIVVAAEIIDLLTGMGVQMLVDSTMMGKLGKFDGVDLESPLIPLSFARPCAWLWLQ